MNNLTPENPTGPELRTATHEKVTVDYMCQGSGPVIVIIPSFARGPEDYEQLGQLLQIRGYKIIRPFPRGMGKSMGPMDNVLIHDLADDIALVLNQ